MTSNQSPRATHAFATFLLVFIAACSSGGGNGGPTEPCRTCPDAALRLSLEFDAAARGLQPAGFRVQDLTRIDILVQGSTAAPQTITLTPPQEASFLPVLAGIYTISATAYMSDLILFTASNQVTIATGDTASVQLAMQAALGNVALEIDGEIAGAIEAVAGEDVPFVVRVRNLQGRPVPNSAVQIHTSGGFGQVAFTGNNATDALGEARGVIRAPHSGSVTGFSLIVDNRSISVPAGLAVDFATNVNNANSGIVELTPTGDFVIADGIARAEMLVSVRNATGEALEGIPVTATSSRNTGVDPNVDRILLLPGYDSGKTDAFGQFRFAITSTTSSFMQLDAQGRLFSARDAGHTFIPTTIQVFADGVAIDQRDVSFNSVVNPFGANLLATPQFLPAD